MFFVSEKNLSYPNWKVVGSININHDFYSQLNLVLHFFKCIAKNRNPIVSISRLLKLVLHLILRLSIRPSVQSKTQCFKPALCLTVFCMSYSSAD